jgi:cytochrome P450
VSLPPGPSTLAIAQTYRWVRQPYAFLEECRKRYGKTFTLSFVGGRKLVMTSDTAAVEQVFKGDPATYLSGRANRNFKPFFGENSIVVQDGDEHKQTRRLIMPALRGERMSAYDAIMRDLTLEDMRTWPRRKPFPILPVMQRITLNVIYEAVFGVRDRARRDLLTQHMIELMTRTSGLLAFMPRLQIDLGRLSPWGRYLRTREKVSGFIYEEIARARKEVGQRDDILAKFIEESQARGIELSDASLRDHLLTMVAAGHETTGTGLAWTFQFLLAYPRVLERAKAEVREVVGDEPVRAEHVGNLRYLDAIAQEALRLFPPIPIVLRWLSREVTLGEWTLPAETVICPCTYLLHREPELYTDPLAFRPERFLDERPGPFRFTAFGGGARLCAGIGFAYFEMKIILATVLARASLRLDGAHTLAYTRNGIALAPKDGTRVVLEELRCPG